MRLWTLHPRYLDGKGLVALWREALLAKAVLAGETKGYRHHPQLERFKSHDRPLDAIRYYLGIVYFAAENRNYSFDLSKVGPLPVVDPITATEGQIEYEWEHLMAKLRERSPETAVKWAHHRPDTHPLFKIIPGNVEDFEWTGRPTRAAHLRPRATSSTLAHI